MYFAVGDYVTHGSPEEGFAAARALGADGVEVRFGPQDAERHPLLRPGEPAALRSAARAAGVALPSVYVGYWTAHPLSVKDADARRRHADVLDRLIPAAVEVGARVIVLPLFGAAEPRDEDMVIRFIESVRPLAERAAAGGLALGLETALPVTVVLELVRRVDHPGVCVAYDAGTAAALGWDAVADLKLLGGAVGQLRARDCTADGRRVPLGQGVLAGRWPALRAAWVASAEEERWCVLEVPTAGDPTAWAQSEIAFLRQTAGGGDAATR